MTNLLKQNKQNYLFFFYCFLIAFFFLMFTSKNSFLYAFNDWADANSFFTVGKSIFRGIVPYRDLFEQKGPLLYFIYGLGSLFSSTTFYGVFFLEIFFFSFFLYYLHKAITLFLNKKYTFLLLPAITYIMVTSLSFTTTGSAEEFCLPTFSYTFYSFLKYFKEASFQKKDIFINGVMAGMVFMIKYTMLGFWMSLIFFLLIHVLIKKGIKTFLVYILYFLIGMFIPFGICSIYFLLNDAFLEFIECYFIMNIKYYPNNLEFFSRLKYIWIILSAAIYNSRFLVKYLFIWLFFLLIPIKLEKYAKFAIIITFFLTHIGMYWGLREYSYYFLPMYLFLLISFIGICILFERYLFFKVKLSFSIKKQILFFTIVSFILLFRCYYSIKENEYFLKSKKTIFQYQFADYINQYEYPTLLNVGSLDMGIYTTSNISPNTRFFHLMNFDYNVFPDNDDALKEYVLNGETLFIVYTTDNDIGESEYDFSKYKVVKKSIHKYDRFEKITYLLQLR